MEEESTDLVTVQNQVQRPAQSPMPAFTAEAMGQAFEAYRKLQAVIDRSMPDQIMKIGKGDNARAFRKKGYWRAVATAFNLTLECIHEQKIEEEDDWGYAVTYNAINPSGRRVPGEAVCMASEKRVYQKDWDAWRKAKAAGSREKPKFKRDAQGRRIVDIDATEENATVHNIRSHAHTRAANRAISNLVGFGEVSAEEIPREEYSGGRWESEDPAPSRQERQKAAQKAADKQDPPKSPEKSTAGELAEIYSMVTGKMPTEEWKALLAEIGIRKDGRSQTPVRLAALRERVDAWLADYESEQTGPEQTDPEIQKDESPIETEIREQTAEPTPEQAAEYDKAIDKAVSSPRPDIVPTTITDDHLTHLRETAHASSFNVQDDITLLNLCRGFLGDWDVKTLKDMTIAQYQSVLTKLDRLGGGR